MLSPVLLCLQTNESVSPPVYLLADDSWCFAHRFGSGISTARGKSNVCSGGPSNTHIIRKHLKCLLRPAHDAPSLTSAVGSLHHVRVHLHFRATQYFHNIATVCSLMKKCTWFIDGFLMLVLSGKQTADDALKCGQTWKRTDFSNIDSSNAPYQQSSLLIKVLTRSLLTPFPQERILATPWSWGYEAICLGKTLNF